MTRQEARKKLFDFLHADWLSWTPDSVDVLQMAIDALGDVPDRNVGDMISRQAAIDATWEEPTYTDPINVLTEVRDRIKELPSAQPEPCEDCVSRKAVIRLLHSSYHSKSMIEEVKELPSAQPEPLTDREQRIFLAAMGREEKVCEEVERNRVREAYEDSLMWVCKEIKRKVKGALWT